MKNTTSLVLALLLPYLYVAAAASAAYVLSPAAFVIHSPTRQSNQQPLLQSLPPPPTMSSRHWIHSTTHPLSYCCCQLIPIRHLQDEISSLYELGMFHNALDKLNTMEKDYELCLVEERDLPDVARFVVASFGADSIRLSQGMNSWERILLEPAIGMVNGYSSMVAFAEVLAGLRSRLAGRIQLDHRMNMIAPNFVGMNRNEQIRKAASTSVVLVLAKKTTTTEEKEWQHCKVIGSVEIRLEPCDAKIPFTLPWLDRIERRMGSVIGIGKNNGRDLQPYLSNLCVDETYRGKGIGRALVRVVESVASTGWGYSRIYLHVDPDNESAFQLYKSENYKDVGLRWSPFWAGAAKDILYLYKNMNRKTENLHLISEKNRTNQKSECQ